MTTIRRLSLLPPMTLPTREAANHPTVPAIRGSSNRLCVPLDVRNVVAVRLDFADGPLGVNVYREIILLGTATKATSN